MPAEVDSVPPPPRRAPGRPRSEVCRVSILDATADLLHERPYAQVTIESVAARARVSKQTIYKWWKSRASLAMEAYGVRLAKQNAFVETGNIKDDLTSIMLQTCRLLSHGRFGVTIAGFIAEAQIDPDLAREFRDTYIKKRRQVVAEIIEHAQSGGALRADIDPSLMVDLMFGPVWYRLLLRNAPLDDAFARSVVDAVLAYAKP